ncbi:glycosyltransferase family 2 protein [Patescibacteria group bacterium]|nr:glycosyltransferase family 2 protein [Patescibacteria group bacterium]
MISVIIPAYNEEENLPVLLQKIDEMFRQSGLHGEAVVINDGSTDDTQVILDGLKNKFVFLKTIEHTVNSGVTASLENGISRATGDILIYYPADLQYLPEDIPKLVKKINDGCDIVTGWRQGKYGGKAFVSKIYNFISRLFFKISVHDLNSVKAFKKEIFSNISFQKDWHRYMVVLAAAKGYKVAEVRITLYPRMYGKSKFGPQRVLPAFWDFVVVLFVIKFSQKPMRLFGNLGLISFIIGLGLLIYLSILHWLGEKIGDRPLLLISILLIFVGIQFIAIGLLGELINQNSRKK